MNIISEWWQKNVDPPLFYDILRGLKALCFSVVQLKGKHCRKPHYRNGVIDTFRQDLLYFWMWVTLGFRSFAQFWCQIFLLILNLCILLNNWDLSTWIFQKYDLMRLREDVLSLKTYRLQKWYHLKVCGVNHLKTEQRLKNNTKQL